MTGAWATGAVGFGWWFCSWFGCGVRMRGLGCGARMRGSDAGAGAFRKTGTASRDGDGLAEAHCVVGESSADGRFGSRKRRALAYRVALDEAYCSID